MIKLFEEYNNDYYQEITRDEYIDAIRGYRFTPEERDFFLNPKYDVERLTFQIIITNPDVTEGIWQTAIEKGLDEWYYVKLHMIKSRKYLVVFYKCDQWEGVKAFLKDKLDYD